MHSLDFLTPSEVIEDCVHNVALPAMIFMVIGLALWTLFAVFAEPSPDNLFMATGFPFWMAAIYGNAAIYNVRARHGIRMFIGKWWLITTTIAITWSLTFAGLGLLVEAIFQVTGLLDRGLTVTHAFDVLMFAAGFALAVSLIPAKQPFHLF